MEGYFHNTVQYNAEGILSPVLLIIFNILFLVMYFLTFEETVINKVSKDKSHPNSWEHYQD